MHAIIRPLALAVLAFGGAGAVGGGMLTGCATVEPRDGFADVQATIEERVPDRAFWRTGGREDEAVDLAIEALLDEHLTADAAAQIALLNNRHLQATYEELGVAQADLVQAGLLSNPVFSGSVTFPLDGGAARPSMGVAQSFLDVFFVPLRERIAMAELTATQQRVAEQVIDHAARTRSAVYRVQADKQVVQMLEQVTAATAGSLEMMQRLHEAGNVTDLDLYREETLFEQARMALEQAEAELESSRERATVLMGLWGEQVAWEAEPRLPELPEEEVALDELERRAIAHSLELAALRDDVDAAGFMLGFRQISALLPMADVGAQTERRGGEWFLGPQVSLPVPIFDQGQARQAEAASRLRGLLHRYEATAVEVRSAARTAARQVRTTRRIAEHYRDVMLPLSQRVYGESLRQFNAMEIGIFDLIAARQEQMEAGRDYIEAVHDYWIARTHLEQVLAGSLPEDTRPVRSSNTRPASQPAGHGGR